MDVLNFYNTEIILKQLIASGLVITAKIHFAFVDEFLNILFQLNVNYLIKISISTMNDAIIGYLYN